MGPKRGDAAGTSWFLAALACSSQFRLAYGAGGSDDAHVPEFVLDLEACIHNHAWKLADTFPEWGNKCGAVTDKVDYQAKVYEETLTPIYEKWGYTGALWCATYSLGMVPIVDATQPNNPNFDLWYTQLLCPWDFPGRPNQNKVDCGKHDNELTKQEEKGHTVCAREDIGNPAKCAPHQHPQYEIWAQKMFQQNDPNRRTMSCALCGRLARTFPGGAPVGAPDLIKANIGVEYSMTGIPEHDKHAYTAWWDMHAFGAWLANMAGAHKKKGMWDEKKIIDNINLYKASNGEEIHGFLWESLRLLAYNTGTLDGTRQDYPEHKKAVQFAHTVCEPTWWLSPQSMNDCAHAAGHGYFYYFFDIGRAVLACTDASLRDHVPGPEYGWDADAKSYGWDGINLMMWRWLCATGVYHAAANTLSLEILQQIGDSRQSVEEYLCKHQNVWGVDDVYFDRCAAGLGISDSEKRLEKVMNGHCQPTRLKEPAAWEKWQMQQFGPSLQLSCDPANAFTGFVPAMGGCPEAFRIHFPCQQGSPDYEVCTGEWFGMDVKKDGKIVAFHRLCGGHDVLRKIFECVKPAPHKPGTNMQLYALEWSKDHPWEPKPWNVIDWTMGTNVGVWGGWCTCPDGRVYQVGDEGNMCGSVACDGGTQGECLGMETEGAFRKVICDPGRQWNWNSRNQVIDFDETVGVWGGECTCPDGEVYLVGDNKDGCSSLACEGGRAGPCNHYVSHWAHHRVRCDTRVQWPRPPPPPPFPPPSPPSPPPPPPRCPPSVPPPPPPSPPPPSPPPPRPPNPSPPPPAPPPPSPPPPLPPPPTPPPSTPPPPQRPPQQNALTAGQGSAQGWRGLGGAIGELSADGALVIIALLLLVGVGGVCLFADRDDMLRRLTVGSEQALARLKGGPSKAAAGGTKVPAKGKKKAAQSKRKLRTGAVRVATEESAAEDDVAGEAVHGGTSDGDCNDEEIGAAPARFAQDKRLDVDID